MEREQIGMFEAKTHFSEIVDRILRNGRSVTVTRRGQPVVQISPCNESTGRTRMTRDEALKALEELRSRLPKMNREEIARIINEGRAR